STPPRAERRPRRFCQQARARVGWCVGSPRDRDGSGRRRTRGGSTRPAGAAYPSTTAGSELNVYAIVRAGGRQEKVSVGDVLTIDKVQGNGNAGDTVELAPVLLVDGSTVTTDADTLSRAVV